MINSDVFRDISYGMYIVGTLDGEREVGCIVNSIMQITSQNPTIAISINHDNYTNKCIEETKMFSVSILPEVVDRNLISIFGFSSSKDNNKWENTEYIKVNNMPVLKASCGYMICEVVDKLETDTHTVFLGKVIQADKLLNDTAMTYTIDSFEFETGTTQIVFKGDVINDVRHEGKQFVLAVQLKKDSVIVDNIPAGLAINIMGFGSVSPIESIYVEDGNTVHQQGMITAYFNLSECLANLDADNMTFNITIPDGYGLHAVQLLEAENVNKPAMSEVRETIVK